MVDLNGHGGLRAVAALWIVIHHCFQNTQPSANIMGNSFMPLFFILSGFALAVSYAPKGKRQSVQVAAQPIGTAGDEIDTATTPPTPSHAKAFNFKQFYQNRFARVFPAYYLCNLIAIPYWYAGFGEVPTGKVIFAGCLATTFVPIAPFFLFYLGGPLDGPSWTVSTMAMIWLAFPCIYLRCKRMSNESLVRALIYCYWAQYILVMGLCFALAPVIGFFPYALSAGTMHPLTGCLFNLLTGTFAGELSVRYEKAPWPWQEAVLGFLPLRFPCRSKAVADPVEMNAREKEVDQARWAGRLDRRCVALLILTVGLVVADVALRLTGVLPEGLVATIWLQALVPYAHLEIIVACTREGGLSRASVLILRTRFVQWIGKVSMSIYLVHWLLIWYLNWALNGRSAVWPDSWPDQNCSKQQDPQACENQWNAFMKAKALPMWGVLVVLPVSLALGALLFYGFEEPARRKLQAKRS